ncbi:MAG TPA: type VI secretion system Vgr family protein [Trinickia sp.]|nr:type VI secretion system Vgr family protein [Trinickia sp.]
MASNKLFDAAYDGGIQRNRLVKLDTPLGDDWLLPLYVKGRSRIGRDFEFVVDAVSTRGDAIDIKALIGAAVTLWIQQADATYRPHHGYLHACSRLGADGYLTFYQLRFSSWLHFLRLRRDMRDWQEQSGEQIVADVFDAHPQAQGAYRLDLRQAMPSYSYRVQWEYDWNFVHRSLEEAGVFGRFEQAPDGKSHTLVLADDLYFVPQLDTPAARFLRVGVDEETEGGFTQWKEVQRVQSATLTTRTFDYKRPDLHKHVSGDVSRDGSVPAQGEVYDYTGGYTWGVRDRGDDQAAVRLEGWTSEAKRFYGVGGWRSAMPGYWFTLEGHPLHDLGAAQDKEFAILEVTWTIRNNLPGMDDVADFSETLRSDIAHIEAAHEGGIAVEHADGSEGFFQVEIEAQRRRTPYRSPLEHNKPVMQWQPAIVAGPAGEEIHTDALNRVKVWFPWNRLNERDEKASCWVRAGFADAGSTRGGHFPMRSGDEVLVGFVGGDCDRPVVVGRMHGGATPPVWHTNGLLSGLRSKEYGGSGFNQLVMDDATGQNRIHLYTTSDDSHLHLGHLVDHTGNVRGDYLGAGFDLKSNAHGAIRAEQGLYISTHSTSTKHPLDASAATSQLANAQGVIDALSHASMTHQAETLQPGQDSLKAFADTTRHAVAGSGSRGRTAGGGTGRANAFTKPIVLAAAPRDIAFSTMQSTHIATDEHVNLVSGQSTHLVAGKSLIASVSEKISLFAQNAGVKLFAGKGKVEIQAQGDNVELTAQKRVRLLATTDTVKVAAQQAVFLTSGGAYIRIQGGNIEIHAPGTVDVKAAQRVFNGPTRMDVNHPDFKDMPTKRLTLKLHASPDAPNSVPAGMPYKLFADGALVKQGVIDRTGYLPVDHHVTTQQYRLEMANGTTHEIPVPGEYRGDAINGRLANQGFQFHEGLGGGDAPPADRAQHRASYNDLLNPPSDV